MSLSVVLLAYKEADNLRVIIPQIIEQVQKLNVKYEILVVDANQTEDDSKEVCELFQNVRYINQENVGFGDAFKTAIKNAKNDDFLIMDADGSHNPKDIPSLYNMFHKDDYDVVIGSRYIKGGSTSDSKANIRMSHLLNGCFRVFVGLKAKDLSTDYRIYRTAALQKLKLKSKYYNILQEVLLMLRLSVKHLKIAEVPIHFEKRQKGTSKRKLFKFIIFYIGSIFRLSWIHFFKEVL